jgi:hypothetical protein
VRYWELGNEAAGDGYTDKFHDVNDYLAAARAHEAAIRAVFPDAETAVTTMNRDFQTNSWNRAIAAQHDFKNVVIHRYVSPAQRSKRQEMAKSGTQLDAESQLNRLLSHSDPDNLDYERFFPGKHFWITEWGMLYTQMDIQNSMAHALWMGRAFFQFQRNPDVEMATYFTLNAPPFELIADQDGRVVHRVPFYVYTFMLKVVAAYQTTAPVNIQGRQNGDIVGQYFASSDGRSAVMLVNASGKALELRVADQDRDLVIDSLGAAQLGASNGHSGAMTATLRTKTTEDVVPAHSEHHGRTVSLPAYGVVLVQMH